jgi:hypothetical protein
MGGTLLLAARGAASAALGGADVLARRLSRHLAIRPAGSAPRARSRLHPEAG